MLRLRAVGGGGDPPVAVGNPPVAAVGTPDGVGAAGDVGVDGPAWAGVSVCMNLSPGVCVLPCVCVSAHDAGCTTATLCRSRTVGGCEGRAARSVESHKGDKSGALCV